MVDNPKPGSGKEENAKTNANSAGAEACRRSPWDYSVDEEAERAAKAKAHDNYDEGSHGGGL